MQESVDQYLSKGFSYSRSGNPTVRALEQKIAALENGVGCTCYSTGMAAEQVVFQATLSAGDHAIVSDVAYGGTYRLATKIYSRFGVEFTFVDTANPDAVRKAIRANTKLIFTETPANPTLKLTDIAAISKIAKRARHPARRRQHVPDAVLTSGRSSSARTSRCTARRSTSTATTRRRAAPSSATATELDQKMRFHQNATGVIMSPFVAWLTLQGTKTLSLRIERQSANAQVIAEFLEKHPKVTQVRYPGLTSFPQHALAKEQASGFGAMLWFEVEGGVKAGKKLMDSVKLCTLAENLGLRRDADHASRHDDARRRRAGGAAARRHHGRPRAPVRRASRTSRT